ncbi:MAG: NAD(+) synthase [Bacteroidaceae bacterium]|nr:NAD(+) synthase [Bacteroidaceae bacterium]
MNYGFVKVAAAVPSVKVGDCKFNVEQIESQIIQANNQGVEIICFPELSITSYSCQDLFFQQLLLDESEMTLIGLLNFTRSMNIITIVGMPVAFQDGLVNCAAVLQKGKILGLVPKTFLPNYKEFYEKRWFMGARDIKEGNVLICGQQVCVSANQLFHTPTCSFGIEICEDLWAPIPPSSNLTLMGADIVFNLSANSSSAGKYEYLCNLVSGQSARCICGYVYTSCGFGESTTDVVFNGKTLIYENGKPLKVLQQQNMEEMLTVCDIDVEYLRSERRKNTTFNNAASMLKDAPVQVVETAGLMNESNRELVRDINPHPFIPAEGNDRNYRCQEIFDIQCEGLAKRIKHTNCETAVVGISGGLDSTLALLVCAHTFDMLGKSRRGIIGITMPGFGTTDRTYTNAIRLMQLLGITIREISIKDACLQHFNDIGHDADLHDVTYENSQARERTQILMDAANQTNGLVVGTGDLSELALGWATYNGDHMSMYGVNASVPKTLVRHLVCWVAATNEDKTIRETLLDIADTPISPELIPANENGEIKQKTEDLVGPYELHDFFLYHMMRSGFHPRKIYMLACRAFAGTHSEEEIKHWITVFYRRFFNQQFKRSCMPDGPKVGSVTLSPRGDWRMPSDATSDAWIDECNAL